MKKFLFLLTLTSALESALPPLWQSRDEIRSLLEVQDIGRYLDSSEVIKEIKKSDFGYLIITNKHTLEARIRYQPQDMPGPTNFTWTLSIRYPNE